MRDRRERLAVEAAEKLREGADPLGLALRPLKLVVRLCQFGKFHRRLTPWKLVEIRHSPADRNTVVCKLQARRDRGGGYGEIEKGRAARNPHSAIPAPAR